jgi:hypothetical protein
VRALPIEMLTTPDSDSRWNQWADRGRDADAAFNEKARVFTVSFAIPVSIILGVIWILIAA